MFLERKLKYRKDIDGLRAISVIAVILFHMGLCKYGYLGVDVFFVISGFLITSLLYINLQDDSVSIWDFYMRRIRRILPLVLVVSLVALIIGIIVMLPYDLDKLCQSIIATNLFGNNLLEYVSSGDYWSIRNEYKPLMHTWSLGIEEQFYLAYPFLFVVAMRLDYVSKNLLSIISVIAIASFALFFWSDSNQAVFYLLPFRFFEIAIGGIVAITMIKHRLSTRSITLLVVATLLTIAISVLYLELEKYIVVVVVAMVALHLFLYKHFGSVSRIFFENPIIVAIGQWSFSLYMWHQLLLAYFRYTVSAEISGFVTGVMLFVFLGISYLSYRFIEQPFRKRNSWSDKKVLFVLAGLFLVTTVPSAVIYMKGGVVKSFPELDINFGDSYRNMHLDYNTQHLSLDKPFSNSDKKKVLVIGNSFARDWINVLYESKYKNAIEISYLPTLDDNSFGRLEAADVVFSFGIYKAEMMSRIKGADIHISKFWSIGVKNYGENNGIIYANRNTPDYCTQRIKPNNGAINRSQLLKESWGDRYIDLMGLSMDEQGEVSVFDSQCRFISQDGLHFTKAGAKYYASLFAQESTVPNFKNMFGN